MSTTPYDNSYVFVLARTIDILFCGWIWRQYDLTISAECGLELRKATPRIWAIVLGRWFLNKLQANHCELAIQADRYRAHAALQILGDDNAVEQADVQKAQ